MKKRINTGIKESHAMGLIMEGSRKNFVMPEPFNTEKEHFCKIIGASFLGERSYRKFPDAPLWSFQLNSGEEFCIEFSVECTEINIGYTFSMYATSVVSIVILVCISDGSEKKCEYMEITPEAKRFEIPFEFAKSPESIMISMQGAGPENVKSSDTDYALGFAYITLEDGLFASSPIPSSNEGGRRGGELLSYVYEGNGYSSTWAFLIAPNWTGSQLGNNHRAYFLDFASDDYQEGISIFADGSDYGIIKADFIVNGTSQIVSTNIIPVRGKHYAVALRWSPGICELLINGRVAGELTGLKVPDLNKTCKNFYVGSTKRSERYGAFSVITNLLGYNCWLSDRDIQSSIYESNPHLFPNFVHQYNDASGISKATLLTNDSWAFQFIIWLLRIPREWQEYPPLWLLKDSLDEGDCRDDIKRYMSINNDRWTGIPEYFQYEGRTDLLIKDKKSPNLNCHMEFKIWGRNDYKDTPLKPLKYFLEKDNIGIVLMINPNKTKMIDDEYRNNVLTSPTNCIGLIESPFETEMSPSHFISQHNSKNGSYSEILHIIVNKHKPYSEK